MAEEKTQKSSADEIVDELAEDLGVEDEEETSDAEEAEDEAEEASDPEEGDDEEAEAEEAEEEDDDSASDAMAGLGVFDVKKGTKRKKKKKKKEKKKKTPKEKPEGVDEIFNLSGGAADDDLSDYLDLDDIDENAPKNPVNKLLVLVIIGLIVVVAGVLHTTTDVFDDLILLMQGNYQEEMARRVAEEERRHLEEQMAGMPRFGNLAISGRPHHSLIRLNGEVQYGETSDGYWREVRVTSPAALIQDLSIDITHEIEVEAPGHEPRTFTITPDMWVPRGADYYHEISANLTAAGTDAFDEFTARMDGDPDDVYLGTVTFNTVPEGAQIVVNSRVALDEDGEELRTPITLETYFVYDEEEDELLERDFRVDMPPNRGNRIDLVIPDDEDMPKYVMALNRSMWTCEFKDEAERRRIPSRAPILQHCNYVYEVNVDFPALKTYIEEQQAERERIEQQRRDAMGGSAPAMEADE